MGASTLKAEMKNTKQEVFLITEREYLPKYPNNHNDPIGIASSLESADGMIEAYYKGEDWMIVRSEDVRDSGIERQMLIATSRGQYIITIQSYYLNELY